MIKLMFPVVIVASIFTGDQMLCIPLQKEFQLFNFSLKIFHLKFHPAEIFVKN